MMEGFTRRDIQTSGARIVTVVGGSGPPLLLMHGNPFNHLSWRKIAPGLARRFTVVCTDLRGYGDSEKPPGGDQHENYSFRAMAQDQVELDILPQHHLLNHVNRGFATFSWHWFFMIQPYDFPERLMSADPDYFLRRKLAKTEQGLSFFDEAAVADWVRCMRDPKTVHAMCEDYRATATIDLAMDTADHEAGRKVECPALVIWGATGGVGRHHRPEDVWPLYARDIRRMAALPCGHYLSEEAPRDTQAELAGFFAHESTT
jgi:haloacetate dehalogenase